MRARMDQQHHAQQCHTEPSPRPGTSQSPRSGRSQSTRSRPGARRSTTAPRLAHPLEHHPCFRAVIGAAPAIADLARELREEGRDLVGTLAIACGDLVRLRVAARQSRADGCAPPRLDGRPLHRSRGDRRKDQSPRAVAHPDARAASDRSSGRPDIDAARRDARMISCLI